MPAPFYLLVGHAFVAADGLTHSAELCQTLAKLGFDKSMANKAEGLAQEGEVLIEARREQHEDRIAEHAMHAAATEVEMWLQTTRFLLKKSLDAETIDLAMGKSIHAHDHVVTVVAQALRTLASIRTNDAIAQALGADRKAHDVACRGWSLLKRLCDSTEIRLDSHKHEDRAVFQKIENHAGAIRIWLESLDAAAAQIPEKSIGLLAHLGYVPNGVGRPLGGTSFNVVRHERGQGHVPNPDEAFPSTGWSIGRQGRNKENLGKGWVEPTFK